MVREMWRVQVETRCVCDVLLPIPPQDESSSEGLARSGEDHPTVCGDNQHHQFTGDHQVATPTCHSHMPLPPTPLCKCPMDLFPSPPLEQLIAGMEKWHSTLSHMMDLRDDDNTQQVRRRCGLLTPYLISHIPHISYPHTHTPHPTHPISHTGPHISHPTYPHSHHTSHTPHTLTHTPHIPHLIRAHTSHTPHTSHPHTSHTCPYLTPHRCLRFTML